MSENVKLGQILRDEAHRDAVHVAIVPLIAPVRLSPGQHIDCDGFPEGHVEAGLPVGIVDPFLKEKVGKGERFYLCLYPNTVTSLRHQWTHPAFEEETPGQDTPEPVQYPVHPLDESTAWRTPEVVALCKKMREAEGFEPEELPILADMISERGFSDENILKVMTKDYVKSVQRDRIVALIHSEETAAAVRWIEEWAEELDQTYNRLMEAAETWLLENDYTYDNTESYKHVDYSRWAEFWKNYEIVTGQDASKRSGDTFYTCSC